MSDIEKSNEGEQTCIVKRFDVDMGYGFVLAGNPPKDAFLHISLFEKIGEAAPAQGDRIKCIVTVGPKGRQVAKVISVDRVATMGVALQFQGTVRQFDPTRGFGFVSGEGHDAIVSRRHLQKLGIAPLRVGQKVSVTAINTARGLEVETITFVKERPSD